MITIQVQDYEYDIHYPTVGKKKTYYDLMLEDNHTYDGWILKTEFDIISYLGYMFPTVGSEYIQTALISAAKELGCIYKNVYELADDIGKYYI